MTDRRKKLPSFFNISERFGKGENARFVTLENGASLAASNIGTCISALNADSPNISYDMNTCP